MADANRLVDAFRTQSQACGRLGSPFMATLLEKAAAEIERAASIAGLLSCWPDDPVADAVPLRQAAALHALVLSGAAPDLSAAYPASTPHSDAAALWHAALPAIAIHWEFVDSFLGSLPQTNEVSRSVVLPGGFLAVARAMDGQPMHLPEIGASAGLNVSWDRHGFHLGGRARWGDPHAPVMVEADRAGPLPPLDDPEAHTHSPPVRCLGADARHA